MAVKKKKFDPNQETIEKYEAAIKYWEEKYEIAKKNDDVSAMNWATTELYAKRGNLNYLLNKKKLLLQQSKRK